MASLPNAGSVAAASGEKVDPSILIDIIGSMPSAAIA